MLLSAAFVIITENLKAVLPLRSRPFPALCGKRPIGGKKMTLETLISSVTSLDEEAMEAARRRQMELAKPPQSLGRLEELMNT